MGGSASGKGLATGIGSQLPKSTGMGPGVAKIVHTDYMPGYQPTPAHRATMTPNVPAMEQYDWAAWRKNLPTERGVVGEDRSAFSSRKGSPSYDKGIDMGGLLDWGDEDEGMGISVV